MNAGNQTAEEQWVAHERRMHAQWMAAIPPIPMADVRDLTIAGRRARLYRPSGVPDPSPVLLYLHGGGWVLGDIDSYDCAARHLATASTATVISLDYRRAPEHPHPAALYDTITAADWIADHATELGIDAIRIGLAGDSAGGQLAAATALHLTAHDGPPLAIQLLLYPALDLHDYPGDPKMLTRVLDLYVGDQDRDTPDISPLAAPDLTGLPPTVIAAPEHDPLRPQAERLTKRLHEAGVPVHLLPGPGLHHGFLGQLGTLPAADQYLADIGGHIAAMWADPHTGTQG